MSFSSLSMFFLCAGAHICLCLLVGHTMSPNLLINCQKGHVCLCSSEVLSEDDEIKKCHSLTGSLTDWVTRSPIEHLSSPRQLKMSTLFRLNQSGYQLTCNPSLIVRATRPARREDTHAGDLFPPAAQRSWHLTLLVNRIAWHQCIKQLGKKSSGMIDGNSWP